MAHADREMGYDIEVKIGDKEMSMLPFVKEIVGNAIIGMLKALKGYEEDQDIVITIKKKNDR
ncbi:MAG: hypothetical protein SPF55_06785 [Lentihominibacter sp.]|nr:hypothetical protein [Lentihominibacter sp.]